jgi:hypothetical protein
MNFLKYHLRWFVLAYADDISYIVQDDEECDRVSQAISRFCIESNARVNYQKSSFLRINKCELGPQIIREDSKLKVLSFIYGSDLKKQQQTIVCSIKNQYSAGMRIQGLYLRFNVFKAKYKVSAWSVRPEDFSGLSKFVERNRFPFTWTCGQITLQSGFFKKLLSWLCVFSPKVSYMEGGLALKTKSLFF